MHVGLPTITTSPTTSCLFNQKKGKKSRNKKGMKGDISMVDKNAVDRVLPICDLEKDLGTDVAVSVIFQTTPCSGKRVQTLAWLDTLGGFPSSTLCN